MTSLNGKHQLMQSLESLDQTQTAKVLEYVKSLVRAAHDEQRIRQEGLKQIRQALNNTKLSF